MMYFIHYVLTNISAPIAAIFRVILLLPEYKSANVVSCVVVTT